MSAIFAKALRCLFIFVSSLAFTEPSYISFPSDISWVTQESDHFQIIYREGHQNFALRAVRAAEKAHQLLKPIFSEGPEKTWIVLADFQDSTNGYALNFPYPHMVIFAAPPESTGQLSMLDSWLESVILHEYVHILHLYPAHGLWKPMRFLFGTWVVPNGMMPSHFHEGMATFLETELSKGGRGRSSHFSMYRRTAVANKTWGNSFSPMDIMDGSTSRYPHGTSAYFWGETLHRELWARKGKEGFSALTLSYSDNWPYLLNGPLGEVYSTDYSTLWADIFKKGEAEATQELEAIRKTPLSNRKILTKTGYRKLDPVLSPDGTEAIYRIDSPYRDNSGFQIVQLKTGKVVYDAEIELGLAEGLCWGEIGGKQPIVFLREDKSYGYETNTLYASDLLAERKEAPSGERVYADDFKLLSLRSQAGVQSLTHLHRMGCTKDLKHIYLYKEWAGEGHLLEVETGLDRWVSEAKVTRQWKLPVGTWVTGISATNGVLFTVKKSNETTFYRWPSNSDPTPLFTLNTYAHGLRSGKDANEVYAVAAVDKRDEVWRFDLANKTMNKVVGIESGVNGFDKKGDVYLLSAFTGTGYDIQVAAPVSMAPVPIPTTTIPAEDSTPVKLSAAKSYSAFSTLFPKAWLPSVFFVPNGVQFGALIPWFDLSQKHFYSIYGGYDTRGEPFGDLSYNYRFGGKYTFDWGTYYAPSYIFRESRFVKRWGGAIGVSGPIGSFPPQVRLAALFRRQEESALSVQTQSVGFELGLSHSIGFARRPLSISPVNGAKFGIAHAQFFKALGASHNYFTDVAHAQFYVEAPWWKDSVWFLGTRAGYTEGSPFFNSYFDGGGEVLFSQGRGAFLNRGFLNGAFLGRRMVNLNLEYRFPLLWVERGIGYWPLRLNVLHAALVADATTYDSGASAYYSTGEKAPEDIFKEIYYSAGLELKSDWKFFFYLPTLLRVGFYHGFGGPFSQDFQVVFGMEASI